MAFSGAADMSLQQQQQQQPSGVSVAPVVPLVAELGQPPELLQHLQGKEGEADFANQLFDFSKLDAASSSWSPPHSEFSQLGLSSLSPEQQLPPPRIEFLSAQRGELELERGTWQAQEQISAVISQLSLPIELLAPGQNVSFEGLPPLPDSFILAEILGLYFEKIPCILSVIHEATFYKLASQPPVAPPPSPYPGTRTSAGLNAGLLFSMLACAARFHPRFRDTRGEVEQIFYQRARRLTLDRLDAPDMNVLKTMLHLTLFCVENSLWIASYMWLGSGVSLARFLGLYRELAMVGNVDPRMEDVVGGLGSQHIAAEECRRIWWWLRNYDASGASASKRPQMIHDAEYESHLLLPCPESLFSATRYGMTPPTTSIPRTQTLKEFYAPTTPAEQVQTWIGPNGYIAALTALFNRVTTYRAECNSVNILPFATIPSGANADELVRKFAAHERDLDIWYQKLPPWVKVLDSGIRDPQDPLVGGGLCWDDQWVPETYDWSIALTIWHCSAATLHGPDYNMMSMGRQIVTGRDAVTPSKTPAHVTADFMSAARLDEVLIAWQGSMSFGIALEHASRASAVLEEMATRVPPNKRRDTPFFGYCVCQLGLINLIAARQVALLRAAGQEHPNSLTAMLKHRAATSMHILDHQSKWFTASKSGMDLLHKVMTEVAGGDLSLKFLDDLARRGAAGSEGSGGFKEVLVRKAMGQTVKAGMQEPGLCAGTMAMGGHLFGQQHRT
ncbi:hypothetical protein HDU89_007682 [Geranomyces variabilis]|nr:hypothetical protein HDU89_007682 [Geranomyces variabilis]